jgi:choice-of-anchor A domain-containing protein
VFNGGFVGRNNHVGGRIAAKGDVNLLNFLVADETGAAATDCNTPAIVSGGKITFTNGQYATGALSAVGTVQTTAVAGCQTPIAGVGSSFFDTTASCLVHFSSKLNDLSTTGTSKFQSGDSNVFRFTGTNGVKNPEVFSINSNAFSAGYWALDSVAEGSTIVINIAGGGSFANLDMSEFENFSTHTIFNFSDDGDVTVYGVAVQGSILAPQSDVAASNGRILGHLVANTVAPPVSNGIYVQWLGGFTGSLGFDNVC